MTIYEHIKKFAGRPVRKVKAKMEAPSDPAGTAWRVTTDYDGGSEKFDRRFEALVNSTWAGEVRAIVIGEWGESYDTSAPVDAIVAAAEKLPNLTALFLGEMVTEENEVSWINQTDLSPILRAYPRLQVLRVRGSTGLGLPPQRHEALRELAIETGGLPGGLVQSVADCDFPELRHLELWLGTDDYGGDATVEDLEPILAGARWPLLRYLGLRDAEIADMVSAALAGAAVVGRLEVLDLSLGMLSDVGAAALLAGQPLTHLRRLDLHHHFLSAEMMRRLRDELEAVDLDLSDAKGANDTDDRYVAVSE